LRGFKESLAKVRTAVHKIFPRELSPTRLAEKYGSDAKKKGAKKLAAVGTVSEAKNAAADELLARQLETIRAAVPQSTLLPFTTSAPKTPPALVVAPATDYVPWIIGGGFALAAAIILFRGKRP
jgi:hypothetical protein